MVLCGNAEELPALPRAGLLALTRPEAPERFEAIEVLSPSGNLQEAAANLFAAMHRLDAMGLDTIVAVTVPDAGLGLAINDRLRRAANETPIADARREST